MRSDMRDISKATAISQSMMNYLASAIKLAENNNLYMSEETKSQVEARLSRRIARLLEITRTEVETLSMYRKSSRD